MKVRRHRVVSWVFWKRESWVTHSIHIKGADSFETSHYQEGGTALLTALRAQGFEVDYMPCHVAVDGFPFEMAGLSSYGAVILSDIGANSFLLPTSTALRSQKNPDRLQLLADYVRAGGGLMMVGGYMSFQGIHAKANYRGTPVEEVLPARILPGDDRRETPQGVTPQIDMPDHPVMAGLPDWPHFLGYNRVEAAPGAQVLASIDGDPFVAVGKAGKGRGAIFAPDCGPHWGPPEFLQWAGYATLWGNLARWLVGK